MSGKNRPPLDLHRKTEELLGLILDELRGGGGAGGGGGGGSGGSGGTGSGRGLQGQFRQAAGKFAKDSARSLAGAVLAASLDGAVNASRGGSFGGGFQRSLHEVIGGTKVGESLGFGQGIRALEGAQGDLDSITNPIARVAGANAISSQVRGLLADQFVEQNKRAEEDKAKNAALVSDKVDIGSRPGSWIAAMEEFGRLVSESNKKITQLLSSLPSLAG